MSDAGSAVRSIGRMLALSLPVMVALVLAASTGAEAQRGGEVPVGAVGSVVSASVGGSRPLVAAVVPPLAGGVRIGGCGGYPGLGVGGVLAMGDSFSAGEGLDCYQSGTDQSDNQCHRSDFAYSGYVLGGLGHRFVACSGALLSDVLTVAVFWSACADSVGEYFV